MATIHINSDNFSGFNQDELLKIQNFIEELKLTEDIVSEEWEIYAINKKINENYNKHLNDFKSYLKKRSKQLQQHKVVQQKETLKEEDPNLFDDVQFEDIMDDADSSNKKSAGANNNISYNNIPSTTSTTTTTTMTDEEFLNQDLDFEIQDNPRLIKLKNPAPLYNYNDRKNIGGVVLSYNNDKVQLNPNDREKKSIEFKGIGEPFYPIKYYSDTIEQRTKILKETVQPFKESFSVPLETSSESGLVRSVGRVWQYDLETQLPKKFYLLGSNNESTSSSSSSNTSTKQPKDIVSSVHSLENNIPVDYCMFSGQVLMTESKRAVGSNVYYAKQLYEPLALPFYANENRKETGDITVMIASGPFDLSKPVVDYVPLFDLCSIVSERKPHCLILMGPFIDDSNQHLSKYSETFTEIFNNLMKNLSEKIPSSTKVLIVPSLKDVDHDYILPQPPFNPNINLPSNILFVPNPFTLLINESFSIGLTTTEIYHHIESKANFKNKLKDHKEKSRDICKSIINQRNFYPLHPAEAPVSMRYLQHLNFPFTPDILILSKQSPMVTVSNDVLCLGVSPLVTRNSAGSYVEFTVSNSKKDNINSTPVSKRTLVNFKNI